MAEEEFFFGCPVLQRFIQTTEPLVDWNLYDSDPWHELKLKIESERPTPKIVRKRALLCVAFSFEEIAFALKKLRHHDEASTLRAPPAPITGPDSLDAFLVRMDEVSEDVIARMVNDKMCNDDLGATQGAQRIRETIRHALNIARSSTRFLQRNWEQPGELSPCGMEFAWTMEALHTAYDRRFGYLKTIFGETRNG